MSVHISACPVETTLSLIGNKWKVLILRELISGTQRFGELKINVGNVTQKVLTHQLREMETDGLVHRQVYAVIPPKVEYSLTETGRSLQPILSVMETWGLDYKRQHNVSLNATLVGESQSIVHIQSRALSISDLETTTQFLETLTQETDCRNIILESTHLTPNFWQSPIEVVDHAIQSYADFGIQVAIVGTISSQIPSQWQTAHFFFTDTLSNAITQFETK